MEELLNIDEEFIDNFILKEGKFLKSINSEAYNDIDFKFYIGWFIYAIYDWLQEEYDIQKRFCDYFNNFDLKIVFICYILNKDFVEKVKSNIIDMARKCLKNENKKK